MGRLGCSIDGYLNDSKFSEPMPWIGIYVAAASLACCAAMAADAVLGFRDRKFWFPCKFFSLNATSFTIIAVAVKLSVDLNTSMPSREDQLAKLSSAVLICTVMGNSMPSLGAMENNEIFTNIVALGILVITVIVNICMQLATGAIYIFWKEHACVMFLMLLLLVILGFSALVVPTTKHYLEQKYCKKHKLAVEECSNRAYHEGLMKYWMMAHTCSPQFVMGRSVTCSASGVLCLLSSMTLAEAVIRSYLMPQSFNFCRGKSDYHQATTFILTIQTTAVAVGTIAPACRWFMSNFRYPNRNKIGLSSMSIVKLESYWCQRLVELKECPLVLQIPDHRIRKLIHALKTHVLNFCIKLQIGIVVVCKLVQHFSILTVGRIKGCSDWFKELKRKHNFNCIQVVNNHSGSESHPQRKLDLSRFVLYLEGEEDLVELMMKKNCDATEHWRQQGKKKQPEHLVQLLDKYSSTQGFQGSREFDSNQVPSLSSEEPPNCWALPVVTLTSIAVALPNIDKRLCEELVHGVNEGLIFVRLIESHLDAEVDLTTVRKAADIVWLGVDLHYKWLDVDLHKMAIHAKGPNEVLEELTNMAKNRCLDFHKQNQIGCLKESATKWPIKVLAANSLYRVCQTILITYRRGDKLASERLFEFLSVMISNLLCACLSNLRHAILKECVYCAVEEREKKVRHAVFLLGKADKILKIIDQQALPNADSEQMMSIDMWNLLKSKKSLPCDSLSEDGNPSFSLSGLGPSIV